MVKHGLVPSRFPWPTPACPRPSVLRFAPSSAAWAGTWEPPLQAGAWGAQGGPVRWRCFGGVPAWRRGPVPPPALRCRNVAAVARSHLERGLPAAWKMSPCEGNSVEAPFSLVMTFRRWEQGDMGLAGTSERSSVGGRFWLSSLTTEPPHASPPLAEIQQKSLSLQSPFFAWRDWSALKARESSGGCRAGRALAYSGGAEPSPNSGCVHTWGH